MFISAPAFAVDQDVVDGCDPLVNDAGQKKAAASLAAAKSVMDEIMTQPQSTLDLACFNQLASVAAKKACDVFSGDCTTEIEDLIKPALRRWYENFAEKNQDKPDKVNITATEYKCDEMKKAWEKQEKEPTSKTVPNMITDMALQSDTPPECDGVSGDLVKCGKQFIASWEAFAKGGEDGNGPKVFQEYKKAADELKKKSEKNSNLSECDSLADVTTNAAANTDCKKDQTPTQTQ